MKIGISTCPNDTFAFHGILTRKVDCRGIDFDIELMDIEELNRGLFESRFDIAKASFHAALLLSDSTVVLRCGSALGFGVGPLLLAAEPGRSPDQPVTQPSTTLCPGQFTTATLLMKLFHADSIVKKHTNLKQVVFSEIMPQLKAGQADFGVCIHEGRFTWQQQGLSRVEDLGECWERQTGQPLPLGGLVGRRSIEREQLLIAQAVIRDSIEYGLANRVETLPTLRQFAQEFDDEVLMEHVNLYVNQWTIDLGEVGHQALKRLSEEAARAGIVAEKQRPLEILET